MRSYSLVKRLAKWAIGLGLTISLASATIVFYVAYDDAREQQDDLLKEVAWMLARLELTAKNPQTLWMNNRDFEQWFANTQSVNQVTKAGTIVFVRTLHDEGQTLRVVFDRDLPNGAQTLRIGNTQFRVYVMALSNGRHIAVAQDSQEAQSLAFSSAASALIPLFVFEAILFVFLALLSWIIMKPINRLERELFERQPDDLKKIEIVGLPKELNSLVNEINRLFDKIHHFQIRESRFTADAAHELRTPLASLSLQIERLEKLPLSDEAKGQISVIRQSVDRTNRMVNQLLSLKRAQNHTEQTNRTQANPSHVLASVIEELWPEAEEKNIEIDVQDFDKLDPLAEGKVFLSKDNLFTIWRNLIENAIRYSPTRSTVTIRLMSLKPFSFFVCDTGPGITEENRERVFEPFYRESGQSIPGTGLGLAIVKTICEQNHLTIRLDWTDPISKSGLKVTVTEIR